MSLELREQKSLRKNFRRIVRRLIDDSLEELNAKFKGLRDESVHEVRKNFKKVRAVLHLVRPMIGEKAYRIENSCFRDASRPIADVRDARILIETLDKLVEHSKAQLGERTFNDIRKTLHEDLHTVRKRVLDKQKAFAIIAVKIQRAHDRLSDWIQVPNQWSSVGLGLEETYRKARKAFEKAEADPTAEKLHEWRKNGKYLLYQLMILRPLCPKRLDGFIEDIGRIGSLLGDDHDLSLLRQLLTDTTGRYGDVDEHALLFTLIDQRCGELKNEALLLGKRFYQFHPREFTRRLKSDWKAWRASANTLSAPA